MFDGATVLVLGAGASCHLDYPTGDELITRIIETIRHGRFFNYAGRFANFASFTDYSDLAEKLEHTRPSSIDTFLTNFSNDQNTINAGKFFIAYEILRCEGAEKFKDTSECWYPLLRDRIIERCDSPKALQQAINDLKIITFNYDISLEYRLAELLKHSRFYSPALLPLLAKNIIHVYGQVGTFTWQDEQNPNARQDHHYGKSIPRHGDRTDWPYTLATETMNAIRVVGEERAELPQIKKAKKLLTEADEVYFLGFGFGEENVRLLDLKNTSRNAQKIYCTNSQGTLKIEKKIYDIFSEKFAGDMLGGPLYCKRPLEDIEIAKSTVYRALKDYF